jgi:CheY-like chemotaxis protein
MAKYDGKKAVIVDDFATARRFIGLTLKDLGFEFTEITDPNELLPYLETHGDQVDLLLLDVNMPEKGGVELLREVRDSSHNELPVILMMHHEYESILEEGQELEMNGHLLKPFDAFTLSKMLEQALPKG